MAEHEAPRPALIDVPSEIRTERLVIRALRPEDAQGLFESIDTSRESLSPWLGFVDATESVIDSRETVAQFIASWALRTDLPFGVFDAASGQHIGSTGLHRMDWKLRSFEIGYWLRTSAVGHGYMTETVQALTCMAFDALDARRVEIRLDPSNLRSKAIPERLGFQHEGTLRSSLIDHHGEVRSTSIYALVRGDTLPE